MIDEVENRSSHLLAIKSDVETRGEFVNSLIKEVNSAVYQNIEDVEAFVKWLDDELGFLLGAKFRNSGQTCVCANRVLVQEGIDSKIKLKVALSMFCFHMFDWRLFSGALRFSGIYGLFPSLLP